MEDAIPKLNITIDKDLILEGALKIIQIIRPEWSKSKLHHKIFTEGLTNRLIGFYHDRCKKEMVLIRVYGENTDLFIDRDIEVRNMRIMYKHGLASPIYCTFLNGISYGYSPGIVLDESLILRPEIFILIAENLAQMHTLKPLIKNKTVTNSAKVDSYINEPTACLFVGLKKFLALIDDDLNINIPFHNIKKFKALFDIELFRSETEFLECELNKLNSPIVFCHNDLLLKNIVYDEKEKRVTFIDFEYSDYNYQAYDIANHFCEFCGVVAFNPDLYPNRAFQLRWLKIYLNKWRSLQLMPTLTETELEKEVERLYDSVEKFSLAAHFYWSLWALVQASNSSIDCDYTTYAAKRLEEYFKRKKLLFR